MSMQRESETSIVVAQASTSVSAPAEAVAPSPGASETPAEAKALPTAGTPAKAADAAVAPVSTGWNAWIAGLHLVFLFVALIVAGTPASGLAPKTILQFSSGFFFGVFFLMLMDVISFSIPHVKNKTRPLILKGDDAPHKGIVFLAGVLIFSEGLMGWLIGWGSTTGIIFGLGATLTGILYECGVRKFIKYALD